MNEKLKNRLEFLYKGERFAIIIFIPLAFLISYTYPNLKLYLLISFWVSFFFLEFILIQGAYFWYSKWKRLTIEKKSITPLKTVKNLKRLQSINIGIMTFAVILFFIDVYIHYPLLPIEGLLISGFILIFASLEFINYFYVQLSYDNKSDIKYLLKNKKLKQSCLNQDIKRITDKTWQR